MGKLKFGLIGAGNSAKNIATSLNTLPDAEWVAVTSAVYDESKKMADEQHIPKIYNNHKELIADKSIQCVVVSVPHNLHHPITILLFHIYLVR